MDSLSRGYKFEYSDGRLALKLYLLYLGIAITIVILLFCLGLILAALLFFLVLPILPLYTFSLFSKRIKLQGEACIKENSLELRLSNLNETIDFAVIKSYTYYFSRGSINLIMLLKDGRKVGIGASDLFCKTEQFRLFGNELERVLIKHKIPVTPTFLEKKPALYLLLIITAIIIVVNFVEINSYNLPLSIIAPTAFLIAGLWGLWGIGSSPNHQ